MNDAFARVPPLLAQHILLSAAAILLGLAVALPLGLWSARRPNVARIAIGFASLVQTIPSLALLALFYPVLLAAGALTHIAIPALGFLPSLLALALYALLPILRNLVTGLAGLDPAVIEAADGIGMTAAQKLRLVEVPLVAPVLMAGVRTAAVWTIGAATLATTVGQPSLGDLIFAGLQTQNWALVLAGCIAAAGLALSTDALLGLVERGIARRMRWQVLTGIGGIVLGIALAAAAVFAPSSDTRRTVVVGAKNFSEQFILARVIGARLEASGYHVVYREGLGSAVAFKALSGGEIGVYVDYAGTIWTNEMHRNDVPDHATMLREIAHWSAAKGIRVLGALGFENAYAFAIQTEAARRLGITSLNDLVGAAPRLALGSDLEFLDRPEWAAVQRAYPLHFASKRAYNPSFMYRAIDSGAADVITAFSSDGRIAAQHLTVLTDPKRAIPGYDAILLVSPQLAGDPRLAAALRPLIGHVSVEAMREANYRVDRDAGKVSPDDAARWLGQSIR